MNYDSRTLSELPTMSTEIVDERFERGDVELPEEHPAVDHPLARAAAAILARSNYREVRSVRCEVKNGQLILSGDLSTYHLKQVAQSIAGMVPGVCGITNYIAVGT